MTCKTLGPLLWDICAIQGFHVVAPGLGSYPPSVPTVSQVPQLREHHLARTCTPNPTCLQLPKFPFGSHLLPSNPSTSGQGRNGQNHNRVFAGSCGSDQARLEPIINNKRRSIREAAVLQPGTGTGLGPLLPPGGPWSPSLSPSATSVPGICSHPAFSQEDERCTRKGLARSLRGTSSPPGWG